MASFNSVPAEELMASAIENTVDLTSNSDGDDEVKFVGSTTSTPQKRARNPSSTHELKSLTKAKYALTNSEKSVQMAKSDSVNLEWNGFEQANKKTPEMPRTPSPLSREIVHNKERVSKDDVPQDSPPEIQRKRIRSDSVSTPTKRARNLYLDSTLIDISSHSSDFEDDGGDYDTYQISPVRRGRNPTDEELSRGGVIVLDPGTDLTQLIENPSSWRSLSSRKSSRELDPAGILIDLDDEEDRLIEELEKLDPPQMPPQGRSKTIIEIRNQDIKPPWIIQPSQELGMVTLKPRDVVEIKGCSFLMISIITKNLQSGAVVLRGYRLERSKALNGILPRKLNEVYLNLEIELNDHRPPMAQGMEEINLSEVIGLRKLNVTNQNFPKASFRIQGGFHNDEQVLNYAPCCLRWKHIAKFLTARNRWHNDWTEQCIERIQDEDPLQLKYPEHFVSGNELRSQYRGETIIGGSYNSHIRHESPKRPSPPTFEVDSGKPIIHIIDDDVELENVRRSVSVLEISKENRNLPASDQEWMETHTGRSRKHSGSLPLNFIDISGSNISTPPNHGSIKIPKTSAPIVVAREKRPCPIGQKYTYGDCFCGAGGSTRGASMAGLHIVWGFDQNKHACTTWRLNFPHATIYEEVADKFILRGRDNNSLIVDILHLSPPCQVFSPAHTVQGKDDEMNLASLFACGMLLDVARPRIVTLEQTFGIILLPRFKLYFNALVLMFTDRGFSVRWTLAPLQNWGLPQRRLRLIVFASCPGEALPEFPPFTHGPPENREGLKPWRSVRSAIENIPRDAPDHNIELAEARRLNCRPWSDDSIAPRCITTHGGQNYHPSGKRGFTYREYACLQGFPMSHKFGSVNVMKQIGNAVPPRVAKVLFSWVRKALEKADSLQRKNAESEVQHSMNSQTEVIAID